MNAEEKYFTWPDVIPELPGDEKFWPFIPPRKRKDPRHAVLNHISDVGYGYTKEEVRPCYHLHELARDLDVALDSNQPLLLEIKLGERLLGICDEIGKLRGCIEWIVQYTGVDLDVMTRISDAGRLEYRRCEEEHHG